MTNLKIKLLLLIDYSLLNCADTPGAPRQWWFGGGTDLTPAYIFEEDVKHFHSVCTLANKLDILFYG